jgi:hypothetical protein
MLYHCYIIVNRAENEIIQFLMNVNVESNWQFAM